jgi:hypothetical protein
VNDIKKSEMCLRGEGEGSCLPDEVKEKAGKEKSRKRAAKVFVEAVTGEARRRAGGLPGS